MISSGVLDSVEKLYLETVANNWNYTCVLLCGRSPIINPKEFQKRKGNYSNHEPKNTLSADELFILVE